MNLKTYQEREVIPLLPLLHGWHARHLGAFPYLYVPPKEMIVHPTDTNFVNEKKALVIVASDHDKTVGVATAIPLNSFYLTNYYFDPSILDRFREKGLNPDEYLYIGSFLLEREYWKESPTIFSRLVDHAHKIGKTKITYIDVIRAENHPLRPKKLEELEPYQKHIPGFTRIPVTVSVIWPTLQVDGSVKDQNNQVVFNERNCSRGDH